MGKLHYALQLYTVRDYLEKDVAAGLQKVRDAGYSHVEVAGTYGLTEGEFKKQLDNAQLKPISVHVGYDDYETAHDDIVRGLRHNGLWFSGGDRRAVRLPG